MSTRFTPQEIASVRKPLAQASLLPPRVYASEELYRLEIERVFMKHWIPFARVSQIATNGYLSRTLFGEPVMVTRDGDGTFRALANVCRHRNRQIVDDGSRCGDVHQLVCPYHGWAYDLAGALKATPHMERAEGFSKDDFHLPEINIDQWQGWIFVNFDACAPKLSKQLATLDAALAPYRLDQMECFEFRSYPAAWNWKVTLENFTEAYHQATIHRNSAEPIMPCRLTRYEEVDGPYNLFYMPYTPGIEFLASYPLMPGLQGEAKTTAVVVNVFPYFHLLIDPTSVMWLDFDIRGINDHTCHWRMMLPPESARLEGFDARKAEASRLIGAVWEEDFTACSGVRNGAASRYAVQGRMSHMEMSVYQFQNWMLDRYLE